MKKSFLLFIHLLFWSLFIFNGFINSKDNFSAIDWSNLVVNFCAFYFNYFVIIPFVFRRNKTIFYISGILSAFLFFTFLRFGIEEILFPIFLGFSNYNEDTTIRRTKYLEGFLNEKNACYSNVNHAGWYCYCWMWIRRCRNTW